MTITTYSVGTRASSRFSATVNGAPLPLWGHAISTQFGTWLWQQGEVVPISWATLATDETVIVEVSLLAGSITSAIAYTNATTASRLPVTISGGKASFTLPFDTCVWLEVNNNRKSPLLIASRPLLPTPTGGSVVVYNGTQTKAVSGTTLVFPPGTHSIGRLFTVETGATVFLHGESFVRGTFNIPQAGNSTITGHGVLSGDAEDKNTPRSLPFYESVLYSLIYGSKNPDTASTCHGITLLDPSWYASFYGVTIYDRTTCIGPWWANANGYFPGEAGVARDAYLNKNLCFVHDDIIDLSEYVGRVVATGNLIGSVASACFIVAYWPGIDTKLKSDAVDNTLVCFAGVFPDEVNPSIGASIVAWCDGGSFGGDNQPTEEHHVVSDVEFNGLRFESPAGLFITMPFDIRNRKYPVAWGFPGVGNEDGQIRKFWFRNIYFSSTPAYKSIIRGKDRTNTPHDLYFENVFYGGVRLTVANFFDYFLVNEFPFNIYVDGIPLRPTQATTGSWYVSDPQTSPFSFQPLPARLNDGRTYDGPQVWFPTGASLPSRGPYRNATSPANWSASDVLLGTNMPSFSTFVPTLSSTVSVRVLDQSVSSFLAGISVRHGLGSFLQGSSSATAGLTKISPSGLAAALASSSGFQATPAAVVSLACSFAGSSSMQADMTPPGTVELACLLQAGSTFSCLVGVASSSSSLQQFDPMKQRVYNTLLALCNAGPFHEAKVDVKTGQMTVFTSKTIKPVSVDVREITKQYQPASRYRRAFNVAEIASWVFEVELRFASGVRASCEVFEQTVADAGITVPPAKGIAASRSLLARLTDSKYDEPPAQNPSLGSVVLFTFEVVPETLRS